MPRADKARDIFYRYLFEIRRAYLTTCTRVPAVEINLCLSRYPKPLPGDKRKRDDACGARNRRRLARTNRRGQRQSREEGRIEARKRDDGASQMLARASMTR